MVDANRDGFIDKEDLKDMYASLGKFVTDVPHIAAVAKFQLVAEREVEFMHCYSCSPSLISAHL